MHILAAEVCTFYLPNRELTSRMYSLVVLLEHPPCAHQVVVIIYLHPRKRRYVEWPNRMVVKQLIYGDFCPLVPDSLIPYGSSNYVVQVHGTVTRKPIQVDGDSTRILFWNGFGDSYDAIVRRNNYLHRLFIVN
jgi:hypothetical protein